MSQQIACPLCATRVSGWSSACPRCRYHPDHYNRAQDDVALIFRIAMASRRAAPDAGPAAPSPSGYWWLPSLPSWLRRHDSDESKRAQ